MDNYSKVINAIFKRLPMYQRIGKAAYKADLKTTLLLDDFLDNPHLVYKSIHVAGTNGKGSVSHIIASVLQEAGYKVGLFTSPHLLDFRERIKVNGQQIDKDFIVNFINKVDSGLKTIQPSFFELTAAMAMDYFKYEKVDIAVFEVGMGGRLDSTNIINPIASVITNIGFDHTQYLGKTLSKIAYEKAGIIKENIPVVIGEPHPETKPVFEDIARKRNAPIIFAQEIYSLDYSFLTPDFNYRLFNIKSDRGQLVFNNLKLDLTGIYQEKNIITSLSLIKELKDKGVELSIQDIYTGMSSVVKNTGLRGRWEVLSSNPVIVCDTGHNIDGISLILNQLEQTPYKKLHMVFGTVDDKNISSIVDLLPVEANYCLVKASVPRALDDKVLLQEFLDKGFAAKAYGTVEIGINAAIKNAEKDDLIFVGGSTFVVADVLALKEANKL